MRPSPLQDPDPRVRLQAYRMLRWAGCADAVLGLLAMLYGDRLIGEITVVGPVTVSELIAAILFIPGVLAVGVLTVMIRGVEDEIER